MESPPKHTQSLLLWNCIFAAAQPAAALLQPSFSGFLLARPARLVSARAILEEPRSPRKRPSQTHAKSAAVELHFHSCTACSSSAVAKLFRIPSGKTSPFGSISLGKLAFLVSFGLHGGTGCKYLVSLLEIYLLLYCLLFEYELLASFKVALQPEPK
jgi:hypothetical protein